jgi:lipopolysaccharide transport system ATP-binding protein
VLNTNILKLFSIIEKSSKLADSTRTIIYITTEYTTKYKTLAITNKALTISNLSKCYSIGKQKESSFRGALLRLFKKKVKFEKDFWAIEGVSFDLKQGEVLGIIGNNGAGKSTLLKILSKITRPTNGRIEINGRLASLLEVGTGFHPELTGRENIFLNGTILGMTKKEVSEKFDEIVEFSGVKKFIDTPVKHYSSGMYVRLAFSVAAHLEPEILIIDEVLAVGDVDFQKKCIGKMGSIAENGRTIIFVSHNMAAIQNLCSRAIFLNKGKIEYDGDPSDCIDYYINKNKNRVHPSLSQIQERKGAGEFIFNKHLFFNKGKDSNRFNLGSNLTLELEIKAQGKDVIHDLRIDLGLNNLRNERISWLSSSLQEKHTIIDDKNKVKILFDIESPNLIPGVYDFTLNLIVNGKNQDWIPNVCKFEILEAPFFQSGNFPPNNQGDLLLKHSFKVIEE